MSLLQVKDLNIEFHDHIIPETVVYDFDLEIDQGEIVGLVGESGSGKSMSAMAIAGLLSRHDMTKRGSIIFDGTDMLNCSRDKLRSIQGDTLSVVFQEPMTSLDPLKKIGYQVGESMMLHRPDISPDDRKKRVIEVMSHVDLDEPEKLYDMYPHELSGGMRQRVMIAAAMAITPKLLIADEPTTALDVTIQAEVIELLKYINRKHNTSILFISHDLSLVRSLCDRVLVMQQGRIVESGSTKQVFEHPAMEYTKKLISSIPKVEIDDTDC